MRLINLKNLRKHKSKKKTLTFENENRLLKGRQNFIIVLKANYFQQENKHEKKDVFWT